MAFLKAQARRQTDAQRRGACMNWGLFLRSISARISGFAKSITFASR
jgi:hypothetical protein